MPERIRATRVAEITGLTVRRVQELAIQGRIPSAAQLGGKMWTFNEARVRRWIEELEEANVCEAARLKEALAYRPARFDGLRITSREVEEAYERLLGGDNWDRKKSRKPRRSRSSI